MVYIHEHDEGKWIYVGRALAMKFWLPRLTGGTKLKPPYRKILRVPWGDVARGGAELPLPKAHMFARRTGAVRVKVGLANRYILATDL